MARKYSTSFNNAPPTYQFYKDRRHDPRWHQAFIEVRRRRYIEGLLLIAAVLVAFILYTEFSSKANPEKTKINPTITHSTTPLQLLKVKIHQRKVAVKLTMPPAVQPQQQLLQTKVLLLKTVMQLVVPLPPRTPLKRCNKL